MPVPGGYNPLSMSRRASQPRLPPPVPLSDDICAPWAYCGRDSHEPDRGLAWNLFLSRSYFPLYQPAVGITVPWTSQITIERGFKQAPGGGANPVDSTGLCLLSLDGGGVRGLSTLYILKSIMVQLNSER
ncbi:putative calcium-independent phospholipase A2-gamma [Rosellinia necatrix]|uniref:Putative calcium-independent phospholipase A2-gamma n=1 Tax=Rosellinia necatrix TaxID=77044 RepID=A0A1S8A6S0_ROSNE|nr:putative calcium-independent phospholipase A2-gamma [Rosellinia necatrix]